MLKIIEEDKQDLYYYKNMCKYFVQLSYDSKSHVKEQLRGRKKVH